MKMDERPISLIIPTFNEVATLSETLASARDGSVREIIVADGDSQDGTAELAERLGATVVSATRGRGLQMNRGALVAAGEILGFLHADTRLPPEFGAIVCSGLSGTSVTAAAFQLGIASSRPQLRVIECLANLRSRTLQLPYGDQALFLSSRLFREIGGFREIPIMEDVDLALRLRARGRIRILPAAVQTSARRWERQGLLRTTLKNVAAVLGFVAGISPDRIARFYGRH